MKSLHFQSHCTILSQCMLFMTFSSPLSSAYLTQNCRLSIWNLQSGKNVRTYKTEAVKGELYKSDIDPSGGSLEQHWDHVL